MKNNVEKLPFERSVKEKLSGIIEFIVSELDSCEKIVLFGSYARCEYKATSDFDLLVLTGRELSHLERGTLQAIDGVDVVIYETDIFLKSNCLLVKQIRRDGILLWQS